MIGNGSGVGIYNWFYVLWRHFRYPYASSLKFVLGQDLAASFDIAAGLVFGTAGFDLKKTAEPPSAHFFATYTVDTLLGCLRCKRPNEYRLSYEQMLHNLVSIS